MERNLHPSSQLRRSNRLRGVSPESQGLTFGTSQTPSESIFLDELLDPLPSDVTPEPSSTIPSPIDNSIADLFAMEIIQILDTMSLGNPSTNIQGESHGVFILPARHSDRAPRFDRDTPSTLRTYIEDYEHIAGKAKLSLRDKIKRFPMYMEPTEGDYISTIKEYEEANNWEEFVEALYRGYPGSRPSDQYSMDDLNSLVNVQGVQSIVSRADFASYDRKFQTISHNLIKEKIAAETEVDRAYWKGLDPTFRERIKSRLELAHPNHSSRIPWTRQEIREQAIKLLENAPVSAPRRTISAPSLPIISEVKRETPSSDDIISQLATSLTHTMETVTTAMLNRIQAAIPQAGQQPTQQQQYVPQNRYFRPQQQVYRGPPPPRNFQNNYNPAYPSAEGQPPGNNVRNGDGILYGPPGSIPRAGCFMCHGTNHYLNRCDVYIRYMTEGKIRRDPDGKVRLANGEEIPREPQGTPWAQRIDEYYQQNPQVLANIPPPPRQAAGNQVQTNFVSVFAIPEVQTTEKADEEAICHLRGQINALIQEAVSAPHIERSSIETTINVLNNRLQKKEEAIKRAKGKPQGEIPDPKKIPVVEIPSQAQPRDRQPKPPPAMPHLPVAPGKPSGPQYRYRAPVESEESHKKVYEKILEQNVILTVEECIATMPTVRRYFKDAITGKRVPTEEEKATGLVEVIDPISSYAMTIDPPTNGSTFEARHSLPLRCVEIYINDTIKANGIIDSGCQVILMRKDVWTKLRVPLYSQKCLKMESANGQKNFTAGLVPRVKISIGAIELWCPVQVVENAPFEVLLGRPFMAIGQALTRDSFNGGMEITITDPDSGESVTIPTYARNDQNSDNDDGEKQANFNAAGFQ